jgi:hypothetical protein
MATNSPSIDPSTSILRDSPVIEATAVDRVRSLLTESSDSFEDQEHCSAFLRDATNIQRYITAENGNERRAAKRLRATLQWMKKEDPQSMFCPACFTFEDSTSISSSSNPSDMGTTCLQSIEGGHYMHVVAYDVHRRPTIYSCLELAQNKDIEDNRKHLISTFETAIQLMPEGVMSWNWVLDMHGFRLVDCDPRLAKIFLSLAADHYPERLGTFFVVDAPALFSGLWNVIENFIDPKTKAKIHFLKTKDRKIVADVLGEFFVEEDVEWFLSEMDENRRLKRGEKAFCYSQFFNELLEIYANKTGVRGMNGTRTQKAPWCSGFLQDIVRHTGGVVPSRIDACKK